MLFTVERKADDSSAWGAKGLKTPREKAAFCRKLAWIRHAARSDAWNARDCRRPRRFLASRRPVEALFLRPPGAAFGAAFASALMPRAARVSFAPALAPGDRDGRRFATAVTRICCREREAAGSA
jgi:hypothetical protein